MKNKIIWILVFFTLLESTRVYPQSTGITITLSNPEYGAGNYIARDAIFLKPGFRYTPSTGSSFSGKIDESLVFNANYLTTPVNLDNKQIITSCPVGLTQGSANVSPTGAANYQIPIYTPQGIAGMQPSLAVAYNSQGGNGTLGIGWNISGISAITRVPKTISSNGAVGGVNFNLGDTYALDGNRLLALSGSYGAENTTYETEVKSFSKIESFGFINETIGTRQNPAGPVWFKVTTKEGNIVEYGNTPDSRFIPGGMSAPYMWLINKITDPNGNFMKFSYKSVNGESAIAKIEYTGNGNNTPSNTIFFYYDTRSDSKTGYIGGRSVNSNLLLRKISVATEGVTVRSYSFGYNINNSKTYLNQVTETGKDNQALNSTAIGWGNYTPTITPTIQNSMESLKDFDYRFAFDYNTDGLSDIVAVKKVTNGSTLVQVFINKTTNGELTFEEQFPDAPLTYDCDNFLSYSFMSVKSNLMLARRKTYDHNLYLSYNEIVWPTYSYSISEGAKLQLVKNGKYAKLKSQVTNISCFPIVTVGDFNNDGIDEIIYFERMRNNGVFPGNIVDESFSPTQTPNFNLDINDIPQRLFTSDYNNDGLLDLLIVNNNGYYIYQNTGATADAQGNHTPSFQQVINSTDFNSSWSSIEQGDFNGDGLPDFILNEHCNNKWHLAINNGNWGFTISDISSIHAIEDPFTTKNDDKDQCIVTDFDHDGKSDLIIVDAAYIEHNPLIGSSWGEFAQENIFWYKSTGNDFVVDKLQMAYTENYSFQKDITIGDFNGDGKEDLINFGSDLRSSETNDDNFRLYTTYKSDQPNFDEGLVKTISDGFNNKTNFTYQPISYKPSSDDSFYTKSTTPSSYPLADIQPPIYCVKTINSPNGIGGLSTSNYKYEEALAHLTGNGFLGFKTQTVENTISNRRIVTTSELDELNGYLPKTQTVSVQTSGGTVLSSSTSNYSNTKVGNSYFSYLSSASSTDNLTNITSTTTNDYNNDLNGNLFKVTNSQGGGFWKETKYENYIAAGSWVANKPQKITTTQKHPDDGTSFSISSLYSYNTTTGNVTSEIANSGILGKEVTTSYNYDSWGHPLTTSTTASSEGGAVNLTKTITYDSKGRYVISVTDNSGTTSAEYDPVSLTPTSTTNIIGKKTSYSYDSWGRLAETRLPDGNVITNSISWGDVTDVTKPLYYTLTSTTGRPWTKTGYDAQGRAITEETVGFNNLAIKTETKYNAKGQIEQKTSYSGGNITSQVDYTYFQDGTLKDGRLLGESYKNGKTINYDYTGTTNKETINSKLYSKTYDNWGNIKQIVEPSPGGTMNYSYYSNGKVKNISYPTSSVQMTYDELGYQKTLVDPSSGNLEYRYDAVGRLTYQKDGSGNETHLYYDNLGRLDNKTNQSGIITTKYKYFSSTGGKGQIEKVTTDLNETWDSYEYDDYGRQIKSTSHIDGTISDVVYQNHYDSHGNIDQITYPGNYVVSQQFDGYGNLIGVQAGGSNIWILNTMTATNYEYTLGLNQVTKKEFSSNGFLKSIVTANGATQASYYDFDEVTGLLKSREDRRAGYSLKETFTLYDDINRLVDWKVEKPNTPTLTYSIQYDKSNITQKTGVGTYWYDGNHHATDHPNTGKFPHALKYIDPETNGYSPTNQDLLEYTGFGKVKSITQNGYTLNFTYGTDEERVKTVLTQGGSTLCTNYYAGLYEVKKTSDGTTKEYYYISAGDGIAAVLIKTNGNAGSMYYLHKDHLGSIICITNTSGGIVEEMSFDPWGRRRNPSDWSFTSVQTPTLLTRGFTGHEHLNEFAMINMNGRVYDPVLGMFISPDNYMQQPGNSQSFNRYSYCINNPLIYTDPNGQWFGLDDLVAASVGAITGYVSYGLSTGNWGGKAFAAAGVCAAVAWVGWNTMGAGAKLASSKSLSAGISSVFGSSGSGFGSQFAALTFSNSMMHQDQLNKADEKGWNGVWAIGGYSVSSILSTSLDPTSVTRVEGLRQWAGVVLTDNISDNMNDGTFNFHSFHVGPIGYNKYRHDDTWGGLYTPFSKGLKGGQRFDMAFETILGLSLIKTDPSIKYKLPVRHHCGDWTWSKSLSQYHTFNIAEYGYLARRSLEAWNLYELIKDNHTLYQHWYGNHYYTDGDNDGLPKY